MSFTYNNDGLRTTKTVNGVTTTYYYQGSLLIAEETSSQIIVYLYDANGSPVGFRYRDSNYASGVWDTYGFEKNLQGDIVAVYDASTGTKLISYRYNAWGVCSTTYHNSGSTTTAIKNPFKYRGYYYDSDLGLYYLQTRYYDPATCRFISPDSLMSGVNGSLHGFNLYAYCFNNPISFTDSEGNWPKWMEDAYEWVENKRDEAKEVWNDVTELLDNITEVGTITVGYTVSLTLFGVVRGVQSGKSIDSEGVVDEQVSVVKGGSTSLFGISFCPYVTVTDAPSVENLLGDSKQIGGSAGILVNGVPATGSFDYLEMQNSKTNEIYHGISFAAGLGTPGAELHYGNVETFPAENHIDIFYELLS